MDHSKHQPPHLSSLSLDLRSMEFSNKIQIPNYSQGSRMDTQTVLEEYGLSRETAAKYVDAITRSNQTQTADELDVSRDTINRYKNAFRKMDAQERLLLISTLTQEKLLDQATE
jgi:hypothetical protein